MKHRICLVNPKLEGPYPPLGLGYVASYLEKYGRYNYELKIIDGNFEKDIFAAVKDFNPHLIGFGALSPQIKDAVNLSLALRSALPESFQVLGGFHGSSDPEKILKKARFEAVVIGEGEVTFKELVDKVVSGERKVNDLEEIKNIAFLRNGEVIFTDKREEIEDLDILPFPKRELFNMNFYLSQYLIIRGLAGNRITTIHTSRGCPFDCTFCSSRIIYKKTRYFSIPYVINELNELVERFNVKSIFFTDDTFILDKQRIWQLCEAIIKSGLNKKIKWEVQGRANLITWGDLPLFKLMKDAGCVQIDYGFEVGDDDILRFLKKENVSVEQNRRAIEITKKSGLKVLGTFMLAIPGETDSQMGKTENFIKENFKNIDYFQVFIATPFPGSELYNICLKDGLVEEDYFAQLEKEKKEKGIKIYSNSVTYNRVIEILDDLDKLMLKKISLLTKIKWLFYNFLHFPKASIRRLMFFLNKNKV